MQAADRTSTIINTATPASRPGSVDELVPGLVDELAPGPVDELAPGPLDELGSSANAQKECLPEFIVLWSRVNYYLSLQEK